MKIRKRIRLHGTMKGQQELAKEYIALFSDDSPNCQIVDFDKFDAANQSWLDFLERGDIDLYIDDKPEQYRVTGISPNGMVTAQPR